MKKRSSVKYVNELAGVCLAEPITLRVVGESGDRASEPSLVYTKGMKLATGPDSTRFSD